MLKTQAEKKESQTNVQKVAKKNREITLKTTIEYVGSKISLSSAYLLFLIPLFVSFLQSI